MSVLTITEIYQAEAAAQAERQRQYDEQKAREKAETEQKALAQFNADFPEFAAACAASGVTVEGASGRYSSDTVVRFSYKSYQHFMGLSHHITTDTSAQRIGTIQPDKDSSYDRWGITRLATILYNKIVQRGDEWEANCEPFRTSTRAAEAARNCHANNREDWVDFDTFRRMCGLRAEFAAAWAPNIDWDNPDNPTSHPLSDEEKAAYWLSVASTVDSDDAQDWPWNPVSRP